MRNKIIFLAFTSMMVLSLSFFAYASHVPTDPSADSLIHKVRAYLFNAKEGRVCSAITTCNEGLICKPFLGETTTGVCVKK